MTPQLKRGGALLLALGLAAMLAFDGPALAPGEAGGVAGTGAAAVARKPAAPAAPAASPLELDPMAERGLPDHGTVDMFAGKSWYVPPPPPPPRKPPPPPKPVAPPVPYTFLGSYQEPNGRLAIFLARGERVFTVAPGDILEGLYRVEGIAAGRLRLVYLPLDTPQSLDTGEAS